jgi:hypothetical protein
MTTQNGLATEIWVARVQVFLPLIMPILMVERFQHQAQAVVAAVAALIQLVSHPLLSLAELQQLSGAALVVRQFP